MTTTFIYELIDPRTNEVRYVGKSNNPIKRLNDHLRNKNHNNQRKKIWVNELKALGIKPIVNIIDEVSKKEWEYWEILWIQRYKTWGANLLNIHKGGNEVPNIEEIKKKRVESIKKFWRNHPEKLIEKNKKISEGVKNSTVAKWTPELHEKARKSQKEASKKRKPAGGILWKEKGLKHPQFKEVVYYDHEGNVVKIFNSAEDLTDFFGYRIMARDTCRKIGHNAIKGNIFRFLNPDLTVDHPNTKESVLESVQKMKYKNKYLIKCPL